LAFKGGTALHQLYGQIKVTPIVGDGLHSIGARFSEDIDLVQLKRIPIGEIMLRINKVIDFFDLDRKTRHSELGWKSLHPYRSFYFEGERRLKIEINCRQHFNELGLAHVPFKIDNPWFSGQTILTTYDFNEIYAGKLSAFYNRSKDRDLFDLYYFRNHPMFDIDKIAQCFPQYVTYLNRKNKRTPTKKQFLRNIELKMNDRHFEEGIYPILTKNVQYNQGEAFDWIKEEFLFVLYDALKKRC